MDAKEQVVNEILDAMNLEDAEQRNKLQGVLWIKLNDYELKRIENTDIIVYDGEQNEKILQQFAIAKSVQGLTKRTLKHYGQTIKMFLCFMENKPLSEITTNDIRYFLAVKKERDHNSDTNINNIRHVLSTFYAWMYEEEMIDRNPMIKIKKVKQEKQVKKAFTEMEVERLRKAAKDDDRMTAILEVMLSTGCRVGEIRNMNRDDLKNDEIVVKGKGKKERIVYLNTRSRFALKEYLEKREDNNKAMFVSRDEPHERLEIPGIEIAVRRLGKKAEVSNTHPHRFRRTAATTALNRGMPIEQVRQMLGHESLDTTLIYAQSSQESVKQSHKKYLS